MRPPKIITTARLRLRPPNTKDAATIFKSYAQDRAVTKFLLWKPHKSIRETHTFLKWCTRSWKKAQAFPWTITDKKTGELIGMVEIRVQGPHADLGYVLARNHWGKGYMPEAVKPVVKWALKERQIYRVWAVCDTKNTSSMRVLEKVGMKREGILRRWSVHPNISSKPRDSYSYSIVK